MDNECHPISTRHPILPILICLIAIVTAALTGCAQLNGPPETGADLAPTIDRLPEAYADLAGNEFAVIADFENPIQSSFCQLVPEGLPGSVSITTEHARQETGVGALKVPFLHQEHTLLITDRPEAKWSLIRDWSEYNLFLVSVYADRPVSQFTVTCGSGSFNQPLSYTYPTMSLEAGWNLLRLDVGELIEHVDLQDIRRIAFSCPSLSQPTDLYFDDLLLVDNRQTLFATADRQPGDLQADRIGRRIAVRAIDRFELVFARGHVRQWYDLTSDPNRLRNLVSNALLGPTPALADSLSGSEMAIDLTSGGLPGAQMMLTEQKLLEACSLYITLETVHQASAIRENEMTSDYRLIVRYTIYRQGAVYIDVRAEGVPESLRSRQWTLAFSCSSAEAGKEPTIIQPANSAMPDADSASAVLLSSFTAQPADLLVAPAQAMNAAILTDPTVPRRAVLFHPVALADGRFQQAFLTRVWPTDLDSADQALPIVRDYQQPVPINIQTGELLRTGEGDFNNDGFSEGNGYYSLQLENGTGKIALDGRSMLRFMPTFRIVDVADRDVWVYLNGKQIRDTVRNRDGQLLFQLPQVVSRGTLIEIHSRQR